ncbi:uncharacterized protein TRIVIDRAFT_27731 [Trichoderma virens Gv29-8]|uniref:NAD(P)-binding domain-containing protein n=1 Tax=Hypocrea virens (strain Gv29-8 / FGSC 10586) TaxID=413071 RepID=G9MS55_HYPVG|nr:uncharacterized protein TRIVIDRAFT_27731 [Trichoderma virens Gv29-8]EHK22922.1 hypothetical protein TRIVIDRAFT_27731 [Trichoderma virens Gv29-8]UKZ47973.1 hypothetical protein TrVGV298_002209 [Trichoderma virens]
MSTVVGIAGLTGKFAQCVAKELYANHNVTLKGFCRSPQKLPQLAMEKYQIEVIQGQFDDEAAVRKFVQGTNIVICCYFGDPDVMTRGQKIPIDACVKEGVPRYLPIEQKLAGVHVLVGGLIETFWSDFFQIFDSHTQTISYWGTGDEKWDLTTYETAAAYVAALAVDKNASGVFRFRGDYKSVFEIKKIYEEVYQSPLHLKPLGSLGELYNTVKKEFGKDPNNVMAWAPGCFAYWCTNGVAHLGDKLDNEKYPGVIPNDMEEFLKSHKKEDIATVDRQLGF